MCALCPRYARCACAVHTRPLGDWHTVNCKQGKQGSVSALGVRRANFLDHSPPLTIPPPPHHHQTIHKLSGPLSCGYGRKANMCFVAFHAILHSGQKMGQKCVFPKMILDHFGVPKQVK